MPFWVLYSELRMWIEITNGKKEGAAGRSLLFLLSRKLRKSAKIVYNGLEIKDHITKERM